LLFLQGPYFIIFFEITFCLEKIYNILFEKRKSFSITTIPGLFPLSKLPSLLSHCSALAPLIVAHCKIVSTGMEGKCLWIACISFAILSCQLLHAYETYYALHIQDFGTMKTLPVLREVLG
jgi:hypothetical protein